MGEINRRDFLKTGGALAITGVTSFAELARGSDEPDQVGRKAVRFIGDGLSLTPMEYTGLLAKLVKTEGFERDVYATGGVIEKLEQELAGLLGKETAVFLPTGTLANHIALRRLAGSRKRVIVQADSHIYNDSGDCAQKLSGLNLLPIEGEFSADTLNRVLERSRSGRVKTEVGVLSLESPLRRGFNTTHSLEQIFGIARVARENGIGLHLDGARLFMQAAHQGLSPAELAAPFDSIYVSLYKNFNAAGGAVLAGSRDLLADLLHDRRMFGGSPCHVWPMAAVAGLFVDDFIEEYRKAHAVSDQLGKNLSSDTRFRFEMIPDGSNNFWLHTTGGDTKGFINHLEKRNIFLMPPRPNWEGLLMMVNPTIGRTDAHSLTAEFKSAADSFLTG